MSLFASGLLACCMGLPYGEGEIREECSEYFSCIGLRVANIYTRQLYMYSFAGNLSVL